MLSLIHIFLATEPQVKIDYASVANPDTLEEIQDVARGGLLAIAAVVGTTRLIDNVLIGSSLEDEKTDINASEEDVSVARH